MTTNISMEVILCIVIAIAVLALLYAFNLFQAVRRENAGTKRMRALSSYIHEGAMAFLTREYRVVLIFGLIVIMLLAGLGFIPSLRGIDGVEIGRASCRERV